MYIDCLIEHSWYYLVFMAIYMCFYMYYGVLHALSMKQNNIIMAKKYQKRLQISAVLFGAISLLIAILRHYLIHTPK